MPLRNILQNSWTILSRLFKRKRKKRKSEKLSQQPRGASRDMLIKYNVGYWFINCDKCAILI